MKKWHLIIDVAKCENCNNCFLACKDEHCGNDWPGYAVSQPGHGHRWMDIRRRERGEFPFIDVAYLPKPCFHCDDAPCIKKAGGGAIYKRADGIVLIDPQKAKGQKELTAACPYGAIWWNEEAEVPQKCTLCAHLLDAGWKTPRCVQACPTGALSIVCSEADEPIGPQKDPALETWENPQHSTRPRVFYKNLYRFRDCFIAGSLGTRQNGVEESLPDMAVELLKDGQVIAQTVTDAFGDFKFDGLKPESGPHQIKLHPDKYVDVSLGSSQSIGTLWL
jgi:Fe-S-cluster-containing dehydrogenase component